MGAIVAVLNKRGENATETTVAMLKVLRPKNDEAYGIASQCTIRIEKNVDTLKKQDIKSHVAIGYVFSKILSKDKPQPVELENGTMVFDGRIYPANKQASDAEVAAKRLRQDHEETIRTFIREVKGGFAIVVAEKEKLIAGRDTLGIRPLYYGENTGLAALASECKSLWKIGIEKTASFPPGHVATVAKSGFRFNPVKVLRYSKPKQTCMQVAARKLQKLLKQATEERVSRLNQVAVAFSGGLDSSVIAFLAKNSGANVHLIYVSLKNQPEIEYAKSAAKELKLPVNVYVYDEYDVEKVLPRVLRLIEDPDPVKTSVGIPIYWAAENAAKESLKVLLAGQGADELFGGYKRYVDDYLRFGKEYVCRRIFNDIARMHEINFEKGFKICSFHNVELRLPFATSRIAKFAIGLPLELKIEPQENTLRKLVLRQAAKNLGLPQSLVKKPKRAIQYTTGINKTLKKLAKEKGIPIDEYLQNTFQKVFKMMRHE